jgi:hypothetical protein
VTVEVVTFPERLAECVPDRQFCYLELLGETSPALDTSYGELAATTAGGGTTTRVFEYTWTIGHLGVWQHRSKARRRGAGSTASMPAFSPSPPSASSEFWANLKDPAAEVYVLFPQSGGWRAHELGATIKYLTPLPEEDSFLDRTARDVQLMEPLTSAVGQLANVAAPGVGSVVAGSARLVGALAQMKLGSVPQTDGFPWSVATAVKVWQRQTMAGVAWSIPKSMFEELGGRISGGVAVRFFPAREQATTAPSSQKIEPESRQVLAQAVVHSTQSVWAPGDRDDYIKLWIEPTLTPA